jgi:transcriptional/translational regulatory protein YebC/TACO1
MSGHNKWSTIKRKKGAADAKRGQLFTRLAREIAIAAREGGSDIEANFKLRLAVDRARRESMPKDISIAPSNAARVKARITKPSSASLTKDTLPTA